MNNKHNKLKIIILFASYGDGHIQVSRALRQNFQENGISDVVMIDLMGEAHPVMNAVIRYVYLKSATHGPFLYGWYYYHTQYMGHNRIFSKWVNGLGVRKLKEILMSVQPDAVINTYPMMSMPELRKHSGWFIPTFTILTDFDLHDRWLHPEIDKYFVATEDLKTKIAAKGICPERIKVSGIPLREGFRRPLNQSLIYQRYGLDPAYKYLLIMAGAYGVLDSLKKITQTILAMTNSRILLVCGRKAPLKESMELYFKNEPRVHVFGFVESIEQLMAVSSCIITKAGGITLAEALAMNLPAIVFRPLPGQEMENARYLAEKGAVLIADDLDQVAHYVKQLLTQEWYLLRMKEVIQTIQNKDASETVVLDIVNELNEKRAFEHG
jgi:processive 1,2-diacylglycerol beta-glucosyltransferase